MKRLISTLLCMKLILSLLFSTSIAADDTLPFTDVPSDCYYYDAVKWAYSNGITTGTSETTFDPEGICNRSQVVTFIWRAVGCPAPTTENNPFSDVAENSWYRNAVLWAVEQGITNGTGVNTFSPNETCTLAHVITFLYRANGEPGKTGLPESWYSDAMNWAFDKGFFKDLYIYEIQPFSDCARKNIVNTLFLNYCLPGKGERDSVTVGKVYKSTNSADGVSVKIYFRNDSGKEIKYIYFYVAARNAVGDSVASLKRIGLTGPVPPFSTTGVTEWKYHSMYIYLEGAFQMIKTKFNGEPCDPYAPVWYGEYKKNYRRYELTESDYSDLYSTGYWENVWYNRSITNVIVTGIDITYMDETTEFIEDPKTVYSD